MRKFLFTLAAGAAFALASPSTHATAAEAPVLAAPAAAGFIPMATTAPSVQTVQYRYHRRYYRRHYRRHYR